MTLCPVAIAVGCRKCPIFSVCPLKTAIGDQPRVEVPEVKPRSVETKPGDPASKRRGGRKAR